MAAATFDAVSDGDLTRMTSRAWREASRCWAEARREPSSSPARQTLMLGAEAADAYWRDLRDEQDRRLALASGGFAFIDEPRVEVRSTDDRRVTAPWVTRRSGSTTCRPRADATLGDRVAADRGARA